MDKYGLIGYPLGHSFSISYFNQRFHDEDIDAVYENFEIPTIDILPEVLSQNPELKGLNVTILQGEGDTVPRQHIARGTGHRSRQRHPSHPRG